MIPPIRISREILSALIASAAVVPTEETCGLLAGKGNEITRSLPATNAAPERLTTYEIAPQELFQQMREIRAAGLDLLGIYHSHPNAPNEPSAADIDRAYYPDAAYFIISPHPHASRPVRAFSIRAGRALELEIQIL